MIKKIWDQFNDLFAKTIINPQYFLKMFELEAICEVKKKPGGTLLDIGCGRQTYRKELEPFFKKYIGIDHPSVSKHYLDKENPDILADAIKIPLPSNYADTIMFISVLEHLPEPIKAFKEAYRLNKKKGRLILVSVQNYPLHDIPFDFSRHTRFSIKKILADSGYTKIKTKTLGNYVILSGQFFNVFLLYTIKDLIKSRLLWKKCLAIFFVPFVFSLSFLSNMIVYLIQNIFKVKDKEGRFALYNLAIAEKL